jgi:hypothetical protein
MSSTVVSFRLVWGISRSHSNVQVPVKVLLVAVQGTRVLVQVQEPSGKAVDVAMQQQHQEN